uniref:Kinesin-like protein n=1 Tax=Panagrolaimus sp. ES5 TaxID=591445 RepID=A0AC34GR89_9BILA
MAQTDPDSSVKVAIRIRPLVNRELARGDRTVTTVNEFEHQLTIGGKATFTFDHVFDCNTPQSSVYTNCVNNLVEGIFDGYNATVLAYGQTGSGKTHTMGTGMDLTGNIPPEDLGIVPRAVQHIFDGIELRKREAQENGILPPVFEVTVTFVELYNENIFDLLNNGKDRTKITMYENPETNEIQLSGVKNLTVKSPEDLMEALRMGALNRTVGATNMNEQSSRSHAIFSIYLKQQRPCQSLDADSASNTTVDFEFLTAKFHFVDLAGSERIAKTGATGARAKEGCNINMGLLMLGNVIKALADKEQVNYRMSKLTRLLKDSLGGNSRTLMIACASPSECDFVETYNTMQYANRTKNIKNKVVANQDKSSRLIADLRRKIAELETELLEFKSGKKAINNEGTIVSTDADIENAALLAEVNKLNTKVKALQDALDQSKKRNVSLQQLNIQEFARQYDNNSEAGEDSIAVMASKYIEEIEVLKNDLSEAHSTIEDLRKQLSRLKAALTSRGPAAVEIASPTMAPNLDVSEPSDVSNLLKHLKDEIDEKKKNLQDEEGQISVDDEELETADEDSDDEEEQVACEEKERLCDELTQLQDDINVKLQLVTTLERSEQRLIAIKAEYEKKMSNLLQRIEQTEKERNQMLEKLSASNTGKNNSKAIEKKIQEVKDQYEERLNGLKKEFKKFKDMERNHQRMVEQQKRQQQDLERYRREVDAMKKSKVDLMKKINQESKVIQERERAQQKKMATMTKEARKKELKIQQLEMKERQREEFMKRKNEEYNRKIHQAGMDAKMNVIKKAQTPLAGTPRSSKLRNTRSKINWEVIEKSIFKQVNQRQMYEQYREQLESKVAERQQLEKAIEDLNKNFLQLKNVAERQAVTEQLQSYKEKTDYLDNEINELRQEIIGADDEVNNRRIQGAFKYSNNNKKNIV